MLPGNKKRNCPRFQLYARAYVRIWMLRSCVVQAEIPALTRGNLNMLLVLFHAPRGPSPGTSVFPCPQNKNNTNTSQIPI